MESKDILKKQENLYWKSPLVNKKWYRRVYGGTWKCLKLSNKPNKRVCTVWTKVNNECWKNKEIIEVENHPVTNVDSKRKFYRQIFINLIQVGKNKS